ncbi:factor-independent urate hydroxylase [Gandjariella thermophila]|uniref:Uricase n=1 Tax=Gandjariella thermophila TaxID=1931992 RepID=A0A4D4J781_9PSEU|nr:urate oxidase [Gandjariella thermophila]GDY29733.1 uricase [Gandjariella thermophila]
MAIVLGDNQYGKAETRLVRVDRSGEEHRIIDLNVTTTLAGDLARTHLTGDNTDVLPTDSQKNTVFAFAHDGVGEIEAFAVRLARHFVTTVPAVHRARVHIERYTWQRMSVGDEPAPHSFVRGSGTRTATVTCDGEHTTVVSGITDLVVLNSTGSEFWGYHKDRYTTLPETKDRILATAVDARWRHTGAGTADWAESHAEVVRHLLDAFATTHSLSLQQTLYAMGERVLRHRPEVAEIRLSLPNRHHFLVDLTPFDLDNPGEVFHAADRPYGLIEGTVLREDAPPAGLAWW